jgi:hypothetical protein
LGVRLKDRSFWMAEISGGQALALAEAGRIDEAEKGLDEATDLARELKSDALLAQVLNYRGGVLLLSWRFHLRSQFL